MGDKFSKSGVFHLLLPSHVSNIESPSSVFPAIISGKALPIATNQAISVSMWIRFGKWLLDTITFERDWHRSIAIKVHITIDTIEAAILMGTSKPHKTLRPINSRSSVGLNGMKITMNKSAKVFHMVKIKYLT